MCASPSPPLLAYSLVMEEEISTEIEQAVGGIEDIVTGKLAGLTEAEFRSALK